MASMTSMKSMLHRQTTPCTLNCTCQHVHASTRQIYLNTVRRAKRREHRGSGHSASLLMVLQKCESGNILMKKVRNAYCIKRKQQVFGGGCAELCVFHIKLIINCISLTESAESRLGHTHRHRDSRTLASFS